jgi:hypothetical protein
MSSSRNNGSHRINGLGRKCYGSKRLCRESRDHSVSISTESKLLTVKCPKLCFLWWAGSVVLVRVQAKVKWISALRGGSLAYMGFWSSMPCAPFTIWCQEQKGWVPDVGMGGAKAMGQVHKGYYVQ